MQLPSLTKRVETYIENTFFEKNEAFIFAIKNSKKHNLPPIQITPIMGKFLYMQAKLIQANNILEIGTLGGYSTLWFAQALSTNGKITTIEYIHEYAAVAKENFTYAKKEKIISLIEGDAKEVLPKLEASFDLIFIDAHKEEYDIYMEHAIRLSHTGTVIICDNVIRNGGVLEKKPEKEYYKKLDAFNKKLAADPRLDSTILPLMVPLTGRDYLDGMSISLVK